MYNQENKLVMKDKASKEIAFNSKIFDPNDMNLSYVAWKGTTINRKTMLNLNIQFIPREFAPSEFVLTTDQINSINNLIKT